MIKMFVGLVFCLIPASITYSQVGVSREAVPASSAEPIITAQTQPDSPLSISSKTRWLKPEQLGFEIYIVVKNVGDKPIRAYATNYGDAYGSQESKNCFLHNFPSIAKVLQPGQKDGKSVWRRASDPTSQLKIELAVDFVEFTDGSVWGADTCQAMQQLDGRRAGARAAREQLRNILLTSGAESLLVELKTPAKSIEPPPGRSAVWNEAFNGGVRGMRERVTNAHNEYGLSEINIALQRPIDASESP